MSSLSDDDGCVDYQDLERFRGRIADLLQEFIDTPQLFDKGEMFVIYPNLNIAIECIGEPMDDVLAFPLNDLVVVNERGERELNYDFVNEILDNVMFVRR